MLLNILTAITRPQNLPELALSLSAAADPDLAIVWHWRFDPEQENVGGQNLKNAMLNEIDAGWVWILDDDTVAPPGLLKGVADIVRSDWDVRAVIVDQWHGDQQRRLVAALDQMVVGSVDVGQAFFDRAAIGEIRLPDDYNGDGIFIREVLAGLGPSEVRYANHLAGVQNALR